MDLEETRALIAVIHSGSFKSAAAAVKQPRATLRRRVEALEARAGVTLLERSRSGVVPTPAGELLARQGRTMLRESDALLQSLRELGDAPSGEVRIGVSAKLPPHDLAVLFGLFQAKYPALRLHLRVCDDPLTELADHVDIAIHSGRSKAPGHWRSRTLLCMRERLEASRSYLQHHGVPRSIDDLDHHQLLGSLPASLGHRATHLRWPACSGETFEIEPILTTTDLDSLRQFAGLGLGIALLPHTDLSTPKTHASDGELIPVLEGLVGCRQELRAVVPEVLAEIPRIKATLTHLERFAASLRQQTDTGSTSVNAGAGLQGLHQRA